MKIKFKSVLRALTATTKRKVVLAGVVALAGAVGVAPEKASAVADAVLTVATLL